METAKKINLLIVDDEEEFLDLIKKRLESRGFNVITANRGEKAVEKAGKQKIDIALVDLKMPGMDGEATLQALKKKHKWMEIIILTGHGSVDSAITSMKKGAYHYLQKPCEMDRLIETLTEAYRKSVSNKMKLEDERLHELLHAARHSPLAILEKLRELDRDK